MGLPNNEQPSQRRAIKYTTCAIWLCAVTTLVWSGCGLGPGVEPYWSPGDGDPGNDEVVPIDVGQQSFALANQYIHSSRPQGSNILFQKLDEVMLGQGLEADDETNDLWLGSPQTDDTADDVCPLANETAIVSVGCRDVANSASGLALVAAAPLSATIGQQIATTHSSELRPDEVTFVSSWAREAVTSGVSTGTIMATGIMRELQVCDSNPDPGQRAFMIGEKQARTLVAQAEEEVLPTIPDTQCNTDAIAATILAASQDKITNTTLCHAHTGDDIFADSAIRGVDDKWSLGMRQGFSDSYELLRARLVGEWECSPPPPPPPPEPNAPESSNDPCQCYARHSGRGPVYCFYKRDLPKGGPSWGHDLEDLDEDGVPQCQPDCHGGECAEPKPIGSPLVFDLDDNGVKMSKTTIGFDLAGTGEDVRIQALEGNDALLALDLDGNGQIDSGVELFGNNSMCGERRCFDGVEALAQHDTNMDKTIDSNDAVFKRLMLWKDANHNGKSEPNELKTLATAEIAHIGLKARYDLAWTDAQGNAALRAINFTRTNGQSGVVHDVWFSLSFNSMPSNPRTSGLISSLSGR